MAEPRDRIAWPRRLYVRIYVALLASLAAFGVLFLLWHEIPGSHEGPPRLAAILALLMLTVAVGAYPVVRRLTRRLEHLQRSVEALGSGQLSTRVAIDGSDEVASLAGSFNRSAARIEALVEAQRNLLANASHELRSPLARMRMAVELLQEHAPPDVRAELVRNMAELDQLVDEILLASRLDADAEVAMERVDLTGLVAEECAAFDASLDAQAVSLQGNARLLRRMVRNLLENARRHGGDTPIVVRLAIDPGPAIRLEVVDHGPGIPESERENIFAPFHRLPGASEREGGVGLGLSLVRQIAAAHGGMVECVAPGSAGSCFRVLLRCGPARVREGNLTDVASANARSLVSKLPV